SPGDGGQGRGVKRRSVQDTVPVSRRGWKVIRIPGSFKVRESIHFSHKFFAGMIGSGDSEDDAVIFCQSSKDQMLVAGKGAQYKGVGADGPLIFSEGGQSV